MGRPRKIPISPMDSDEVLTADEIADQKRYMLTPEQQREIKRRIAEGNDLNLINFARQITGDTELTPRAEKFLKFREYVTRVRARKSDSASPLSATDVEFIKNNGERLGGNVWNVIKALFPDEDKTKYIKYVRPVRDVLDGFGILVEADEIEYDASGPYEPPRTDHKILAKINEAIPSACYHVSTLDSQAKENIKAMKGYLAHDTFVAKASSLNDPVRRKMFEMELIRNLHNRPNLINEHVTSYVAMCYEMVNEIAITERKDKIEQIIDSVINDNDDEDRQKFNLTMQKTYDTVCKNLDECKKRIEAYKKTLVGDLREKERLNIDKNRSFTFFIDLIRRKEGRDRFMKIHETNQANLEAEMQKLDEMDAMIAESWGISKKEILNF